MIGGLLYLVMAAASCSIGLPLGFALFGCRHAAGWIAGALLGYAVVALLFWTVIQAGWDQKAVHLAVLALASLVTWRGFQRTDPWIALPEWSRRDTAALLLVLLLVPLLQWRPFSRIGAIDETGAQRYRAYFTADFLWHVALTAELTKGASPPRNPYLSRRPLHYYWAYFVPPAVIARHFPVAADIKTYLLANAFLAGLLFVSAIYLFAWCAVPRAGPVAMAVACVVLAASAEGAYALWDLWSRGRPLAAVRDLNIDAITSWWFQTLTIDSLPRSLWYTPQHAMSCALSLVALLLPVRSGSEVRVEAALVAGISLGLAVIFSPFLGGVFSLIYGIASLWRAVNTRSIAALLRAAVAAVPVGAALAWCVMAGTFEGAGGAVAFGLSRVAVNAPFALVGLALGPVLAVALLAVILRPWREWPIATALIAVVCGLALLYFVTLTLEPIWIGWRAGQIILVTIPALVAASFAHLQDAGRRGVVIAIAVIVLAVGLPTTAIDAFNAQDIGNTREAAGFRWTVVVGPDTLAAARWIRGATPEDAVVQMSIGPRRRETWTLIPTFAERRMAAGRPISLMHSREYDDLSDQVDAMYRTTDPAEAAQLARRLRIDFIFVDDVERSAFGEPAIAKFEGSPYFSRVFSSGPAAVYSVR